MLRLLALRIGWTLARGYWKEVFTPESRLAPPARPELAVLSTPPRRRWQPSAFGRQIAAKFRQAFIHRHPRLREVRPRIQRRRKQLGLIQCYRVDRAHGFDTGSSGKHGSTTMPAKNARHCMTTITRTLILPIFPFDDERCRRHQQYWRVSAAGSMLAGAAVAVSLAEGLLVDPITEAPTKAAAGDWHI